MFITEACRVRYLARAASFVFPRVSARCQARDARSSPLHMSAARAELFLEPPRRLLCRRSAGATRCYFPCDCDRDIAEFCADVAFSRASLFSIGARASVMASPRSLQATEAFQCFRCSRAWRRVSAFVPGIYERGAFTEMLARWLPSRTACAAKYTRPPPSL